MGTHLSLDARLCNTALVTFITTIAILKFAEKGRLG